MKPKGRRLAITTGAIALLVLGVAAFAARDRIIETWYIWKIESANIKERDAAIHYLSSIKSERSIPALISKIESLPANGKWEMPAWALCKIYGRNPLNIPTSNKVIARTMLCKIAVDGTDKTINELGVNTVAAIILLVASQGDESVQAVSNILEELEKCQYESIHQAAHRALQLRKE